MCFGVMYSDENDVCDLALNLRASTGQTVKYAWSRREIQPTTFGRQAQCFAS